MSIKVPLKDIKEEDIESFEKHLVIEEKSKQSEKKKRDCPWIIMPKYNVIRRDEQFVYIPYQWGMQYFDKKKKYRRRRDDCAPIKISFKGELRQEQKEILKETVDILNTNGSCMMAIYPGGGKCLGKGTRVLLYSGEYRNVEMIKKGDILIGDDSTKRIVHSISRGREKMYRFQWKGFSTIGYVMNKSHILTLWDEDEKKIIDVPLQELINRDKKYLGVYMDNNSRLFNLIEKRIEIENISTLIENDLYKIDKNDSIIIRELMLSGLYIEKINNNEIYFRDPMSVFLFKERRVINTFEYELIELNEDNYYGFEIDGNGRFLLWDGIVTHNTITSLAISSIIGYKTMILVNKIVLIDQWTEAIKQSFGEHARYQHIKTKTKINPGCQFYIMNAINVSKREFKEYDDLKIGFVIVDECHLIMTKIFSKALSYLCPRYLIGLSATPFRPDGFDSLLQLFFGLRKVVRKLYKKHLVYFWETKIKIAGKKDAKGQLIWNSVIDEQTTNNDRNQKIISICHKYQDRNILILSKRINQIDYLYDNLKEKDNVTIMKDNETNYDKNARILIATFQKVGTGFSHDKLDMLILATDAEEYFIQYLGRVFRRPDVEPIIIDIIDDHPILRRHYLTRRKVYIECGGLLNKFDHDDAS